MYVVIAWKDPGPHAVVWLQVNGPRLKRARLDAEEHARTLPNAVVLEYPDDEHDPLGKARKHVAT